ncbi:MAG: primosomal protein N' [Candidatus Symbiothrix sp.]|jgi:primosomal protein N' (replication factor Y)|nr:primosomal protein N' [Candidatus Symbiothrix sp.]
MMYVELILPVPLADKFTYFVPSAMEAQIFIGSLVKVEFGTSKHYSGIVASISDVAPQNIKNIKTVEEVVCSAPVMRPQQLQLWHWIANYYLCKLGEVARNVMPVVIRNREKPVKRPRKQPKLPSADVENLHALTEVQAAAFRSIRQQLQSKSVCLLHGVTASGKTEIYTHLIQETLDQGKQVLYLLPEIALTTQITDRLFRFFGQNMAVFHSKISDSERVRIWNSLLDDADTCRLIVGVRSSVFLPFHHIGLVIVDEEHEPSYKQQDASPRYQARNVAIMLATMHGGKVVLGSATPSVESFYNAQTGKYGYVALPVAYGKSPELKNIILPVDVKELRRKKQMKGLFSPLLMERMTQTLNAGEQVLLFQNRRGFAQSLTCHICDWTPKCRYCDISLTYHKQQNRLTCHYCGRSYQFPKTCPECGQSEIKPIGYGTEKIEEEIQKLFPDVAVERLDTDTAKSAKSIEEIFARFASGQTRVLIGTQMISKGLDFDNIGLVGIINADALMNYPDFRAYERAYQLMIQVAGRTGRRQRSGEVILQTSHPEHPLLQTILTQNYQKMYEMQMEECRLFRYPPLYRLIEITLKHRKENIVAEAADRFAEALRNSLKDRVVGPDKPAIAKVQNLHLKKILVKMELSASPSALRELLDTVQRAMQQQAAFRYVAVAYNVDK